MIVECLSCHTKYNVDPAKIPPGGVRVRCHKCQNVIVIQKEVPTPTPVPPKPEVPETLKPQKPEIPAPPEVSPPQPEAPKPSPPTPKPSPPPMSEEDKKWHERAKRLAKALASDLVLYNQNKVEQGLREGTLVQLLGSEIRRSWEYYSQQIPRHIVEGTDYFKEQLNKIVGKGKEIFK